MQNPRENVASFSWNHCNCFIHYYARQEDIYHHFEDDENSDFAISRSVTLMIYFGVFFILVNCETVREYKECHLNAYDFNLSWFLSVTFCTHLNGRPFFPLHIPTHGVRSYSMMVDTCWWN